MLYWCIAIGIIHQWNYYGGCDKSYSWTEKYKGPPGVQGVHLQYECIIRNIFVWGIYVENMDSFIRFRGNVVNNSWFLNFIFDFYFTYFRTTVNTISHILWPRFSELPKQVPTVEADYVVNMNGVDMNDQNIGQYTPRRKSMKWYKKLAFYLFFFSSNTSMSCTGDTQPAPHLNCISQRNSFSAW